MPPSTFVLGAASQPREDGRLARLAPVLILVLMAAYALPFAWVNLIPDGIRDLEASLAIARGERFPREGPLINFAFHLGPLSLYLQALPLLFGASFTAVALWAGFLGSLKFPLAYATGVALSGRPLGLLTALAVALPSVAGYQWIFLFHPTLVEPLLWAALCLAARCWDRPSLPLLYGAALAVGAAIQFHPTAALYAPLAWLLLVARRDAFGAWPIHAVALLAPLAVPFLRWPGGGIDEETLRVAIAGVGASLAAPVPLLQALRDVPALLVGMFWDIPAFLVADTLWPQRAATNGTTLARALVAVVGLVALRGVLHAFRLAPRARRAGALALVALIAGVAIVSAMRRTVSFHTLYFLLPVAGVLLGIAFLAATARRGTRAGIAPVAGPAAMPLGREILVVALAALAVAMSARTIDDARQGVLDVHLGGLADPRHVTDDRVRVGRYSMLARDRAGPWLCEKLGASRVVVLHGELAFALASSFGVDLRMHCPARVAEGRLPRLVGRGDVDPAAPVEHWLALPAASWRQLGREPALRLHELGLAQPVAVLHPAIAPVLDTRWRYYEVVPGRQPLQTFRYDVPAEGAKHLLVTRLQPWDTTHETRVTCAGAPQAPVVDTLTTRVYALPGGACEVALTTDVPDRVGIVAF